MPRSKTIWNGPNPMKVPFPNKCLYLMYKLRNINALFNQTLMNKGVGPGLEHIQLNAISCPSCMSVENSFEAPQPDS